ncbi:MAG: hypothetical protein ACE5HO_19775 [bacterium]
MFHELAIPKVFFDSDALIAGCASRQGAAFVLLQLSDLGLLQGLTSQKAVAECRKHLQIKLPDAVLGLIVLKPGDLLQRIRLRLTELANFP